MWDPKIWSDMFNLTLPVAEKILRPVFIYLFLVVALRLAGKRELAQLNPFDLVVLLTLSNTVQNGIIGDDNTVSGALIGAASLLAINYTLVRLLYSNKKLDEVVSGAAVQLIKGGVVHEAVLKRELITLPELESAAHRQGFASLSEVETAILEPGGSISFLRRLASPEETRQQEILGRLEALTRELAELRRVPGEPAPGV